MCCCVKAGVLRCACTGICKLAYIYDHVLHLWPRVTVGKPLCVVMHRYKVLTVAVAVAVVLAVCWVICGNTVGGGYVRCIAPFPSFLLDRTGADARRTLPVGLCVGVASVVGRGEWCCNLSTWQWQGAAMKIPNVLMVRAKYADSIRRGKTFYYFFAFASVFHKGCSVYIYIFNPFNTQLGTAHPQVTSRVYAPHIKTHGCGGACVCNRGVCGGVRTIARMLR